MQRQNQGFTLIEMMVTITILAILAAIVFPSYKNYQIKTREENARADLMQNVSNLEKYYAKNHTYSGYSEELKQNKSAKFFTFSGTYESDTYSLTATPTEENSGEKKSIVYDSVRGMLLCWGESDSSTDGNNSNADGNNSNADGNNSNADANNSNADANNSSAGASNLSHWANCKPF